MALPQVATPEPYQPHSIERLEQGFDMLQRLHAAEAARHLGRIALLTAELAESDALLPTAICLGLAELAIKHPPTEPLKHAIQRHYNDAVASTVNYAAEAARFVAKDSLLAEVAFRPLGQAGRLAVSLSRGLVAKFQS